AFYQAIDETAIAKTIMRGAATPSGLMIAPGIRGFPADLYPRLPYDPAAAKKLLAEAGYPNGFEVGMNCPNDRYVNDASICQAVAAMLAKVDIKVNLMAETKRNAMIHELFKIHQDDIGHIPLHQQALAWVTRNNIQLVQLADNNNWLKWIIVK